MALETKNIIVKSKGRPSRESAIAIEKRNAELYDMAAVKNYPRDYIESYFNLSKGQVSKIIKAMKRKSDIKRKV